MKKMMYFFSIIPVNLLLFHLLPVPLMEIGQSEPATWGTMVFSEVMFDPDPPVRLPAFEYLEVLNRMTVPVSMAGWSLGVNNRRYGIPGYTIPPGERAVLTSEGGSEGFTWLPHVIGVFTSEYALPNDGATVVLYNEEGNPVHAARYHVPWDAPSWKADGGWSLESPDDNRVCLTSGLWEYTGDPSGGTPGIENNIARTISDDQPPVLLFCSAPEQGNIRLTFSEPVWSPISGTEWIDLEGSGRVVEHGKGNNPVPGRLDPLCVVLVPGRIRPDSIVCCEPTGETLMLCFPAGSLPEDEFRLIFSEIRDCAGNLLAQREIVLGMPGSPVPGSILVNEVMYDPWEGDPEFIELLVPGTGYLDLLDFSIGHTGSDTPEPEPGSGNRPVTLPDLVPLSSLSRLVAPGDYLVVTTSIPQLEDHYQLMPSGKWIQVADLGILRNSGGVIFLTDRAGNTVDLVPYSDDMHVELLGDTKGVSLERISADRPGSFPGNWHSTASIDGYSTPGRPNSQSAARDQPSGTGTGLASGAGGKLVVEQRIFSPNNDGYLDLLEILVETGNPGYVMHIRITDPNGITVRELANNHLAGPHAIYTWDGEGDDGRMVAEGIYVVHLDAWHPGSGDRISGKVAVGLVYP